MLDHKVIILNNANIRNFKGYEIVAKIMILTRENEP